MFKFVILNEMKNPEGILRYAQDDGVLTDGIATLRFLQRRTRRNDKINNKVQEMREIVFEIVLMGVFLSLI